jgi:MFS family permease
MKAVPAALQHRDFRRLWLAGLISDSGDWLLLVSLPILVFQLTGSTLQTSFAFLVELAPAVLLGPLAGYLADRYDRRRMLVGIAAAQAVTLLPLLTVHDRDGLPILYTVIAVEAAMLTLFGPAKNALLPTLVPADQLVSANSLVGLNQNLGRLAGGPLGGLLLAVSGLPVIVLVDLGTFVAAAVLIAGIAGGAGPAARSTRARVRGTFGGYRIWIGLTIAMLGGIAQGIFVVLFVVWVARRLGGGAAETGLLRGVQAVGSIAAGLLLATARRTPSPARLIATGAGGFGLLGLVLWNGPAVTSALPVYVVLFILVGVPAIVMITGLFSLLQQEAADEVRGRVFGVFGAVYDASCGTGMLAAGFLGDRIGIMPMLDLQAVLYLTAGATALLLLRNRGSQGPGRAWTKPTVAEPTPTP